MLKLFCNRLLHTLTPPTIQNNGVFSSVVNMRTNEHINAYPQPLFKVGNHPYSTNQQAVNQVLKGRL